MNDALREALVKDAGRLRMFGSGPLSRRGPNRFRDIANHIEAVLLVLDNSYDDEIGHLAREALEKDARWLRREADAVEGVEGDFMPTIQSALRETADDLEAVKATLDAMG